MSKNYKVPTIGPAVNMMVDLTLLNATNQFVQSTSQMPPMVKGIFGLAASFGTLEIGRRAVDRFVPPTWKSVANAGIDLAALGVGLQALPNLINGFSGSSAFLAGSITQ